MLREGQSITLKPLVVQFSYCILHWVSMISMTKLVAPEEILADANIAFGISPIPMHLLADANVSSKAGVRE